MLLIRDGLGALALAAAASACAAPPIGLGTGARVPELARGGDGAVNAGAGLAVAGGRETMQLDLSLAARLTRWFAFEAGAAYTQLWQERDDGGERVVAGGFPYLRPRFLIDRVSIAIGLTGIGLGGGGGGFYGGIADAQVGYGTTTWSAYAGAYGHAFNFTSDQTTETFASQLRLGGEYSWRIPRGRAGVALEVYRHHDTLTGDGATIESRFYGAGVKFRFSSDAFR